MKTLNTVLLGIVLIFSGCYTQVLVEDDSPGTNEVHTVYVPVPGEPIVIVQPAPIIVNPVRPPVTGPIGPGTVITNPKLSDPPRRISGPKRRSTILSQPETTTPRRTARG